MSGAKIEDEEVIVVCSQDEAVTVEDVLGQETRCPLCGIYKSTSEIQAHVNQCLDSTQNARPSSVPDANKRAKFTPTGDDDDLYGPSSTSANVCAQCGLTLRSADELADHLAGHEIENEFVRQAASVPSPAAVPAAGPPPQQHGPQRNFGRCFSCGKTGHYASQCPTRAPMPNEPSTSARLPTAHASLVERQRPQRPSTHPHAVSLTTRLRQCVEADLRGVKGGLQPGSCALIASGHIEHFQSEYGYDCGYRNVQMMAAHVLAKSKEFKEAMFGGCGYVPDMQCIQAWTECAWGAGFDPPGRAHFGGTLQGSREWTGTTEACSLLRYFGLDARIVDLDATTNRGQRGNLTAGGSGNDAKNIQQIHPGVACDDCSVCPIVGPRFRSRSLENFDLCGACYAKIDDDRKAAIGPFERVLPGATTSRAGGAGAGAGVPTLVTKTRQSMELWVWRYFERGLQSVQGAAGAASAGTSSSPSKGGLLSGVRMSDRTPLYWQHQGHSRTLVGIMRRPENNSYVYTFLVLDPSTRTDRILSTLEPGGKQWQFCLKRGAHTATKDQYQLLYVEGTGRLRNPPPEKTMQAEELVDISP